MSARTIALAMGGGAYRSGSWWRCRCPVHNSTGPTLALRDGPDGLAVHCHAGCRRGDILDALGRHGLLRGPAAIEPGEAARRQEADQRRRLQRIAAALDLWRDETAPPEGTAVERYWLSRGLGELSMPSTIRASQSWLRHPEGGTRPAMIALVERVEYGPVAIHRTFLAVDGSCKAAFRSPRLCLGPVRGGAVRLATTNERLPLIVAEGIETAASVMLATGLPAWAALSAGGIEKLILPASATDIIIAADHDRNGTGIRAARNAAARWLLEDRRVRIAVPPEPGSDWADVLNNKDLGEARYAA